MHVRLEKVSLSLLVCSSLSFTRDSSSGDQAQKCHERSKADAVCELFVHTEELLLRIRQEICL